MVGWLLGKFGLVKVKKRKERVETTQLWKSRVVKSAPQRTNLGGGEKLYP